MTLDAANLFFEDLVPEPRLEFTLPKRGRRDTHRILSTTKEHVWLRRSKGSAVERRLGNVGFEDGERASLV